MCAIHFSHLRDVYSRLGDAMNCNDNVTLNLFHVGKRLIFIQLHARWSLSKARISMW